MKKITIMVITLVVLCGLVYGQEVPENGVHKEYYENGQLKAEMNYKDGKLDGDKKKYYENGQLKTEMTYKDGKLEGAIRKYYISGQVLLETIYEDGKIAGEGKEFYENGKIRYLDTYRNSRKINRKTFDKKGKLELDQDY